MSPNQPPKPAQEESLDHLAEICHDVFAGRGSPFHGFPPREHSHKNQLPDDRSFPQWTMWRKVARTIQEWPPEQLKQEKPEQVAVRLHSVALGVDQPNLESDFWKRAKEPTECLAKFAIHRAQILSRGFGS